MNYLFGLRVSDKNRDDILQRIDGKNIIFERCGVYIFGNKSENLSVFEDDDVFVSLTGLVYKDTKNDFLCNSDAQFAYETFVGGGGVAYGHFVLIGFDKNKNELFSFGDFKSGRKVFYCSSDLFDGVFSKVKLPIDLGLVNRERNEEFECFSLVYGYFPSENTVYKGVNRTKKNELVRIGEELRVEKVNLGESLDEAEFSDTISETKDFLFSRLERVVESCTQGKDQVAVLLGGFDSALMAALAVSIGKKVKGYTFSYSTKEHNQKNVDSVISALGIEHEWVDIDAEVIGAGLERYSDVFDRPTNWPNYVIQTNYLSKKISEDGYSICLTGDGCDEVFLGYPGIYRGARIFSRDLAGWQCNLLSALKRVSESSFLERKLGHVYRLFHRVLANFRVDKRTRLYYMFRILDESTLNSLFGYEKGSTKNQIDRVIKDREADLDKVSDTILAYEGRENIIPNRLKISGAMDQYDIKLYSPFMHPEIRDYVRRIPEAMLRPSGEAKKDSLGKYVLMEMAVEQGLLPESVVYQPKHAAVDGPLDYWYEYELSSLLKGYIGNIANVRDGRFLDDLLREKAVEKFYKKRMSVDSITGHAVSYLATYGSYWK